MENNKQQTVVQLIIKALDIECKSRGMNVNWDMYLEMEKKQRIKDKLELSASWAKSREQTRETAMHIGFAKGFISGIDHYEDDYFGVIGMDNGSEEHKSLMESMSKMGMKCRKGGEQ